MVTRARSCATWRPASGLRDQGRPHLAGAGHACRPAADGLCPAPLGGTPGTRAASRLGARGLPPGERRARPGFLSRCSGREERVASAWCPVRAHLPARRGGRALAGADAALPICAARCRTRTAERRFAMGARRGPVPVRWEAIQRPLPDERRIEFVHTGGVTRGMQVAWRFDERRRRLGGEHRARAGAGLAADRQVRGQRVIGPQFIDAIAGERCDG